jgi:hypothetical protein
VKKIAASLLFVAFLLSGCHDRRRESEVDRFARLYVRLRVASSSREGRPERARQAREDILRSAGTDLDGYRRELRRLQEEPDQWERFWAQVQRLSDSLSTPLRKGH